MGENNIITQCPTCLTQFNVSDGQLKVANGQVRCGTCLHVFSALTNRLNYFDVPSPHFTSQDTSSASQDKILPEHNPEQSPNSREGAIEFLSSLHHSQIPTLEISSEPVTLTAPEMLSKRFEYGWLIGCLLAILAIIMQFAWFNRAELYWSYPQYQTSFDKVCSILNCSISPRFSLDRIENQNILVTPHPDYEGAIEIKLILNNQAKFQQPFPAVKIEFSDLKSRLVANRILQPYEYLNSNRSDIPMMPAQQPVQISMEIMSPGTRAVNYKLDLLAPQQ